MPTVSTPVQAPVTAPADHVGEIREVDLLRNGEVRGEPQDEEKDAEQAQERDSPRPLPRSGRLEHGQGQRFPEGEGQRACDDHAEQMDDAAEEAFLEGEPVDAEESEDDGEGVDDHGFDPGSNGLSGGRTFWTWGSAGGGTDRLAGGRSGFLRAENARDLFEAGFTAGDLSKGGFLHEHHAEGPASVGVGSLEVAVDQKLAGIPIDGHHFEDADRSEETGSTAGRALFDLVLDLDPSALSVELGVRGILDAEFLRLFGGGIEGRAAIGAELPEMRPVTTASNGETAFFIASVSLESPLARSQSETTPRAPSFVGMPM